MDYHVADLKLAAEGKKRIDWAEHDMLVLRLVRERFLKEKPLAGVKMSACLHVTAETANLCRTLKAGGAELHLCASNPLSTQDDVAASLVEHERIKVFAMRGEDNDTYYSHIRSGIEHKPMITMDDGADLVTTIHSEYPDQTGEIMGSMEETTTGVIRLRAMAADGALKIPVFAVNDAQTKRLFDNRYGTGQSTVDGIIRATDILLAGTNVVTAGYGYCGRGFSMRVRGMGANVIVTEIDPVKAIEAVMDGYRVMPMEKAAPIGDLFCTLTGNINVIRPEHFELMKDGAIVCNSGHFNVELDLKGLENMAERIEKGVRREVDAYHLENGKKIFVLGEGRLINLAAAEGHPASVMDMSFAVQALTTEYAVKNHEKLEHRVYEVPESIDKWVSELKLKSMNVAIDKLTPEQEKYLATWTLGT